MRFNLACPMTFNLCLLCPEVCRCFKMLQTDLSENTLTKLKTFQEDHRTRYGRAYGVDAYKPKHRFRFHIPAMFRRRGFYIECFAMESKHRTFKLIYHSEPIWSWCCRSQSLLWQSLAKTQADSSCFPRIWWKSKHGQVRWRDLQAAMMQFLELCRVKPCSYLARLCDGLLQWRGSTLHSITGWNFSCWSIPACVPAPCLILVQPCWAASFSASCVSHVEIRKKICLFGRQNRILNALDDIKLIHRVLASRVNRRDAFSLVSRGPKRLDPSIKGMKQRTDREAAGGPLGRSSPNFTVLEQKRDLIDKTTLL